MLYCLSNAECPDLPDPVNGRLVVYLGNSVGDTATCLCDSGFELVGAQTVTCQANGMWSDPPPTCEPIGMKSPLYCRMIIMAVTNSKPPNHVTLNYKDTCIYIHVQHMALKGPQVSKACIQHSV